MKSKRSRSESTGTAFVPRIVLKTMMASVVPAIAATAPGCGIALAVTAFDATDGDAAEIRVGVADVGFDAGMDSSIDAGGDVVDDAGGKRDSGIIVLAQIGFEVDPAAARSEQFAEGSRTRRRNGAIERASRRGRA
jgi:hypothetical protein